MSRCESPLFRFTYGHRAHIRICAILLVIVAILYWCLMYISDWHEMTKQGSSQQPSSFQPQLNDQKISENFSLPKAVTPSVIQELYIFQEKSSLGCLLKAMSSHQFVAATRTNLGRSSGNNQAACVVDPAVIDCHSMGLAAFILLTLEHIALCHALGSPMITVLWRGCDCCCAVDASVDSWEWYFEPLNPRIEASVQKVLCIDYASTSNLMARVKQQLGAMLIKPILDNSFRNRTDVPGFSQGSIIDLKERHRVHPWISKYLKPNAKISQQINDFYHRNLAGYNLLGVHVRGTDHWKEISNRKLPPLYRWTEYASTIFESMTHPRKVFVASDNNEAIFEFVKHFGKENVAFIEAFRSNHYRGLPAHGLANSLGIDPRTVSTQVLVDILLLAKCDHFVHAESSVAALAAYFNPHMKSYFLEDTESPKERDKRETTSNEDSEVQEEMLLFNEFVECFKKNIPHSACPSGAKGNFVDLREAEAFLNN